MITTSKSEIEKLEDLIREKHPDWHIEVGPLCGGQILTLFQHGEFVCDVIFHRYSFGSEEGLLEWWNQKEDSEPIGWLSAEEALILFEGELKGVETTND